MHWSARTQRQGSSDIRSQISEIRKEGGKRLLSKTHNNSLPPVNGRIRVSDRAAARHL